TLERLSGFAAFNVADRLTNTATQIVVDNEARVFAHAGRRVRAALIMFARERANDEPPRADQGRDCFVQSDTTYDVTEFHPAPWASIAICGAPSGSPVAPMGWQTTKRQPWKLGCFRVATTLPSTRARSINKSGGCRPSRTCGRARRSWGLSRLRRSAWRSNN